MAIATQPATGIDLRERFAAVRQFTEQLCEPLSPEDMVVQSMPDASPAKWHLAHTTWFFETFLLKETAGYRVFDEQFEYLFNSYYNAVGERHERSRRGLLTRPGLDEVLAYRRQVDAAMLEWLETDEVAEAETVIATGLHHEQQHQELLLTDIKHLLSCNPLEPAYHTAQSTEQSRAGELDWTEFPGGVVEIGHDDDGFCFDNELPRHEALLQPYRLANRLVTNREFRQFVEDGGYERPEFWLSDGWACIAEHGWKAPIYWREADEFTLAGRVPRCDASPVCHLSYFEADAYARWAGARLPTEFEWEHAAKEATGRGNFVESGQLHPVRTPDGSDLSQMFGDVWEWTSSAYSAYPGYRPLPGALGEYNGKFMCNQFVLRGGSCVTWESHIRASYRNFFPSPARWQFSGLRLAMDA